MLRVLCLPCLWVKTWSGNFLEPSLRPELAQPVCRAVYSRIEEKRELGMTKVADITASYARCKLSKNRADCDALLQVKIVAPLPSSSAPFDRRRCSLQLVQTNEIGFGRSLLGEAYLEFCSLGAAER